MKTVIWKPDLYSKIIITIIAVSLFLIAIQGILPESVEAQNGYVYIGNPEDIATAIAGKTLDISGSVDVSGSVSVDNAREIGRAIFLYVD